MGRKVRLQKLTFEEWDDLIAGWNDLPRDEKEAEREVCLRQGHTWAIAPVGNLCCVVCLDYIPYEDQ